MADYTSTYTGAQIDANLAKAATALQPTSIDTLAKLNALIGDATLLADPSAFEAAGAVGGHEMAYNHGNLPSNDQKAALDGADTPSGTNPFITADQVAAMGGGDMVKATYDPTNVSADAFARGNHTGEQPIASVTGLQTALDSKSDGTHSHGNLPTADQKAALDGANAPGAGNVFATMGDVGAGMSVSTYDPQGVGADAFDRANHTGEQPIASITDLQTALDGKAAAADFDQAVKTTSGPTFNHVVIANDPTATAHAATKGYVDSLLQGLAWQVPVIDAVDFTTSEPAGPTSGDRYLNTASGTSSGTAQSVTIHNIYEWNGANWTETTAAEGMAVWNQTTDSLNNFNGTTWVGLGSASNHASLSNLQGGTPGEYFHLTGAQHTALAGMVTNSPYARGNHTGAQAISTVTGLQTALDGKLTSAGIDTLAKINAILSDATLVDQDAANSWSEKQTFSGGVKEVWGTLTGTNPAIGQGNYTWTLSGASTPTSTLTDGDSVTLRITAGAHTIDWSSILAATQWIGQAAPTLPSSGSALITLWKEGGTVYGQHAGDVG